MIPSIFEGSAISPLSEILLNLRIKNTQRTKFHKTWYTNFDTISLINGWLMKEAQNKNALIIENKEISKTLAIISERLKTKENEILSN